MNKIILPLLLLAAPLSSQAFHESVTAPLLNENETESNRFGYHVVCTVADDITVSIEVSPVAAVAIQGVVLKVCDEHNQHMDVVLSGHHQKDGTTALLFHLPKAWAEKSTLGIISSSYEGSPLGTIVEDKLVEAYSLSFKNALKR